MRRILAIIGEATETPLKQFYGRMSRPGSDLLEMGDFVPATSYKTIHLKDEWAGAVMGIESPKEMITRNNPALSGDIKAALDELVDEQREPFRAVRVRPQQRHNHVHRAAQQHDA